MFAEDPAACEWQGQQVNSGLSGCNSLFFLLVLFVKPIYPPLYSFHPLGLFLSLGNREGKTKPLFHMSTLQLFQDIYLMPFPLWAKAFLKEKKEEEGGREEEEENNVCFRGIKCTSLQFLSSLPALALQDHWFSLLGGQTRGLCHVWLRTALTVQQTHLCERPRWACGLGASGMSACEVTPCLTEFLQEETS